MIDAFMSCDSAEMCFMTAMMLCEFQGLLDNTTVCKMDYNGNSGVMQIRIDRYVNMFGPLTHDTEGFVLIGEIVLAVKTLMCRQIPELN